MNCIIPFTKDIKFTTNISEILSISLEHEYTLNDGELLGNFIVTGDYKTHEVSVNREHFENVLPFSVSMSNRIDKDSVDFSIEDFTYEIIDNNTLRVNIEYKVNALEIPEVNDDVFEKVEEESIDNLLDEAISEIENAKLPEEDERIVIEVEEIEDIKDEPVILEENKENLEKEEIVEKEVKEEKIEKEVDAMVDQRNVSDSDKEIIMDSVGTSKETFVTYHIHIMRETDTIEAVCTKYNTTQSILGEYNDLSTLAIGDKLIIPDMDE